MKEISIIQLVLPDGKMVMQRRDYNTENSPGLLGFFGGHIEPGETPEMAMKRELSEETSLDADKLDIHHITTQELPHPKDPTIIGARVYFYGTTIETDQFEVYEGKGSETFSLAELKKRRDLAPTARYMLENFIHLK